MNELVSRLTAKSSNFGMHLVLDYNVELYPLQKGETPRTAWK